VLLACAPLGAASSHVAAPPPLGGSECAQGLPQSLSPPCLPYFKSFKLKKSVVCVPESVGHQIPWSRGQWMFGSPSRVCSPPAPSSCSIAMLLTTANLRETCPATAFGRIACTPFPSPVP
jgi:hypothetical protein